MEIIHRDEKYREYIKKIEAAKTEVSQNMSRRSLDEKVNLVYDGLKNDTDAQEYTAIIWLLTIPMIVVFVFSFIEFGGYIRLIPIVMFAMFLIYFRINMTSQKKAALSLKKKAIDAEKNDGIYLPAKIKYLSQGISVKLQRVKMVRSLYALFFPLFVTFLVELIKGTHIFGNFWISLLVTYLICGIFWWLYFVGDIDDLEFTIKDFKDDLSQLVTGG